MNNGKAFRYQLDSLLTKRRNEYEEALASYALAQQILQAKQQEFDLMQRQTMDAEHQMRLAIGSGQAIDTDEHDRIGRYLAICRTELSDMRTLLDKAEQEVAAELEAVTGIRESIRALEKHRDGRKADFDTDQNRLEQKAADDLWLSRPDDAPRLIGIRKGN